MQREAQETKTCQGRGGAKRKARSREQHDQNMEVMMKEEMGEESHRAANGHRVEHPDKTSYSRTNGNLGVEADLRHASCSGNGLCLVGLLWR